MEMLSLQQVADYLEVATINQTIGSGHAIVHFGRSISGVNFVLVVDDMAEGALTESM